MIEVKSKPPSIIRKVKMQVKTDDNKRKKSLMI